MEKAQAGGALAIGVGDKILMLENAIYSILSPEGYASILWKDSTKAKEAAEVMKLTAHDLLELGIIDEVLKEPKGGASSNIEEMSKLIKEKIISYTEELFKINVNDLVDKRYKKYRAM